MDVTNKALVLDLIEWISREPRPYSQVMEAWRTSCPRLPIWEDAVGLGLVTCERRDVAGMVVTITPAGRSFLEAERRS